MGLLWIGGCQSVAWQDERVLGADVAAIQIEGSVGSAMGSVVSIGSQGLLVGRKEPGNPGVRLGWNTKVVCGCFEWCRDAIGVDRIRCLDLESRHGLSIPV